MWLQHSDLAPFFHQDFVRLRLMGNATNRSHARRPQAWHLDDANAKRLDATELSGTQVSPRFDIQAPREHLEHEISHTAMYAMYALAHRSFGAWYHFGLSYQRQPKLLVSPIAAPHLFTMGSYGLLDRLSWRCECNRWLYPEYPTEEEGGRCLFCSSCTKWRHRVCDMLAHHTRFEKLSDKAMRTVITFLATNAHEQHQRAITEHILLTPGSPLRSFSYSTNGLKGNISQCEDILDRILSFVSVGYLTRE